MLQLMYKHFYWCVRVVLKLSYRSPKRRFIFVFSSSVKIIWFPEAIPTIRIFGILNWPFDEIPANDMKYKLHPDFFCRNSIKTICFHSIIQIKERLLCWNLKLQTKGWLEERLCTQVSVIKWQPISQTGFVLSWKQGKNNYRRKCPEHFTSIRLQESWRF